MCVWVSVWVGTHQRLDERQKRLREVAELGELRAERDHEGEGEPEGDHEEHDAEGSRPRRRLGESVGHGGEVGHEGEVVDALEPDQKGVERVHA